jgi:CRISPR-associated protein Csm5
MTSAHFTVYQLVVEPLSPIHVGSGTTIEPYEYDLREEDNDKWLFVLDLPAIFSDMSPAARQEYDSILRRNNYPILRKWLRMHYDRRKHVRFRVQVQPSTYDELVKNQDNPERLGQIELAARHAATGRPYLPGSSIKGSIRTAVVADAAEKSGNQSKLLSAARNQESNRFEALALGHIDEVQSQPDLYRDPFRQVIITDIPLDTGACYIDRVIIVRQADARRPGQPDPTGILMYRDMTYSMCDGEVIRGKGEIRFLNNLVDGRRMKENRLPREISHELICAACNCFYIPKLEHEISRFKVRQQAKEKLLEAANSARGSSTQCIIRLGRHSHFECVTVGEPYVHKPRRGAGATRTYSEYLFPLGWARLTFR